MKWFKKYIPERETACKCDVCCVKEYVREEYGVWAAAEYIESLYAVGTDPFDKGKIDTHYGRQYGKPE